MRLKILHWRPEFHNWSPTISHLATEKKKSVASWRLPKKVNFRPCNGLASLLLEKILLVKLCKWTEKLTSSREFRLRSYIQHSRQCLSTYQNSAVPRIFNSLLGVWKYAQTRSFRDWYVTRKTVAVTGGFSHLGYEGSFRSRYTRSPFFPTVKLHWVVLVTDLQTGTQTAYSPTQFTCLDWQKCSTVMDRCNTKESYIVLIGKRTSQKARQYLLVRL